MMSVDSAIRRGKWLFKYPWKIWWILTILYILPLLPRQYQSYSNFEWTLQLYFESPLGIIGLGILLFLATCSTIVYFSFYKKWKQWAFENVDDPKAFVREAIRQHFYLTSKELDHLRRVEIVHAPL